jgi:hypothetical protein
MLIAAFGVTADAGVGLACTEAGLSAAECDAVKRVVNGDPAVLDELFKRAHDAGVAGASAYCNSIVPGTGPLCGAAAAKLLNFLVEQRGTLTPAGSLCLVPSNLPAGFKLEDSGWCNPLFQDQTCAETLENARKVRGPGTSQPTTQIRPTDPPVECINPGCIAACHDKDRIRPIPGTFPFKFETVPGELHVYGETAAAPFVFDPLVVKYVGPSGYPPGSVAVFDPSIGKYRILAPV